MASALRASTIEGQITRVADLIAYVNHDIDDAIRAGLLRAEDLPRGPIDALGASSSSRIGVLVKDVVTETFAGGLSEIRMSDAVLEAVLRLRSFLFEAVYENTTATAEFRKATDILSRSLGEGAGAARRVPRPRDDRKRRPGCRGPRFHCRHDDRYAVRLFEQLFIPKPWATE